jgi:hypothetical protein
MMIERQEKKLRKERSHLLSVEGQPTKAVLAQTCMSVFFICSVPDTIFEMLFFKLPADHLENCRGLQFKKHCSRVEFVALVHTVYFFTIIVAVIFKLKHEINLNVE